MRTPDIQVEIKTYHSQVQLVQVDRPKAKAIRRTSGMRLPGQGSQSATIVAHQDADSISRGVEYRCAI